MTLHAWIALNYTRCEREIFALLKTFPLQVKHDELRISFFYQEVVIVVVQIAGKWRKRTRTFMPYSIHKGQTLLLIRHWL